MTPPNWLFLIPLILSIAFLLRTTLIMIGLHKGPILSTFEKYGDAENVYYPLPALLLWSGVLILACGPWLSPVLRSWFPIMAPAALAIGGSYFAYMHPELAEQHPQIFMVYPRWYFELRERTTRQERRRLAYMWLWLPLQMRMAFNGNDRAFSQWADLVIMATMPIEDETSRLAGGIDSYD